MPDPGIASLHVDVKVKERSVLRWLLLVLCRLRLVSADTALEVYKWALERSVWIRLRGRWERLNVEL